MRNALCALLLVASTTGCISVQWSRSTIHPPIADGAAEAYSIGDSTMGDALAGLGAPLYVWELPHGSSALAWGWFGTKDLGVQVSVPTKSYVDPSFQYTDIDNRLRGHVMVFDRDDRLRYLRRGYLSEIADDLREAPVFLVEGAEERRERADD